MRRFDDDPLRRAARGLRSADAGARLSRATRAAIVERATVPAREESPKFTSLFVPMRRLAWLGTVPAVLVAVLIATLPHAPERRASNGPRLEAAKQGGEIVFTIANGKAVHTVVRSDVPYRFDESRAERVRDRTFRDSAESGPALVFYKID